MTRRIGRRAFLRGMSAVAALPVLGGAATGGLAPAGDGASGVMTVTGPIDPADLGVTLPHEHVLVDFVGAEKVSPERYDADEVFRTILPHLKRVLEAGCQAFMECTPAYLGRDPKLLARLSTASGVRLLTNTGYYGAAGNKHLPAFARDESADQLAARWLAEWKDGIDGTGIRPGFIKIGVDAGPLSDLHRKLVRAAARTHKGSGLAIACHTGDGRAALDQLAVLKEEGVSPAAWIWVHANAERDPAVHLQAARAGGWVEFDGVGPQDGARHVRLVLNVHRHGLLNRVLISQDAGWYNVGTPAGGNVRPYDYLLTKFIPALKEAGLTDEHVRQLTVDNPREAFTVRKRSL